ncbi:MAG TPA: ABC transporter permease [Cyclobacteriaceae bacterium]|nr:ABC transporter permease [Cyclobacteriaceae bacterium]
MIKNYLKVAFRSLVKQKAYSAINILGLSIGVACCLLIVLFVSDEFSYDKFHEKGDRIYKFTLERIYPNHSTNYAVVPHSFGTVIPKDFPEVEQVVRIQGPANNVIVDHTNKKGELTQFEEQNILAAEKNFFNVFSIKLLQGDPNKVLANTTDVVITEKTAKRYFGAEDPIGKTFRFFNQEWSVTGVSEDVPENSHFDFDFIVHWGEENQQQQQNFTSFSVHTYLLLSPGADAKALEAKFPKMVDTYAAAQIERDLGKSWADYKKEGNGYRYFLQPLTSIHLDPTNIEYKLKPVGGSINQVYILIAVAVLIVLIACINFMNLATARSAERAREVGVRKTMGSAKSQLVYQFLTESLIISFIATALSLIIVELSLPAFNNLAHKQLTLTFNPLIVTGLLGLALVVGIMAGSYPAFILSAFNPVTVMKGNFGSNAKGTWLRNGLVVFQFWISIVLMVGTLVVSDQMAFMQKKELGYNKEQLLVVERTFQLRDRSQTFKDEIEKIPGVQSTAATSSKLGDEGDMFGAQFQPEGSSEILTTKTMFIDDDFASTIGFEFLKGHGYSKETNDSLSIILNETAVKTMGLGADPVGQKLSHVIQTEQGNRTVVFTIIGVIKDFNFQSLRDKITPLTIQSNESPQTFTQYVYARLNSDNYPAILKQVELKWKEMISATRQLGEAAEMPFKYQFLEDNLLAAYEAEQRAGTLFKVFSTLAIAIACVGLFGLAAYTANLRTKEIGIRKVMGASVSSVIMLLTKEFTKLIGIAFLLAVPLSWYMMDNWLNGFAFRTNIGVGTFLIAGALALGISWLTVSYQSVKAALKNPVNSLKSE